MVQQFCLSEMIHSSYSISLGQLLKVEILMWDEDHSACKEVAFYCIQGEHELTGNPSEMPCRIFPSHFTSIHPSRLGGASNEPSNPTNPHSPHCHFPFFRLLFCSGHSLLCLSTKSRKICSLPQHNSGCILLLHIVFFVACYNFLLARMNEVNFGNG